MTQDQIFSDSEGDQWFRRNAAALADPARVAGDPVLRLLDAANVVPRRALEVGGSNGYRLHALHARHGCEVTAVEPSQEAIDDGVRRHPAVRFVRGLAGDIPLAETFDLVIVHFVLHWVDRGTLLRSVAEIDRTVADGGYLVIGDFAPPFPQRVPYHHLPEANVFTFKQHYADLFVASNLYENVASLSSGEAPDHRTQVTLLRKTLHGRYAAAVVKS